MEISAVTKESWGILPEGFEVVHEQIRLNSKYVAEVIPIDNGTDLTSMKTEEGLLISNEKIQLMFNKHEGRLTSYIYNGRELIKDRRVPKPNFWRAVTDNDLGNQMHIMNIEWEKASIFSKVAELTS